MATESAELGSSAGAFSDYMAHRQGREGANVSRWPDITEVQFEQTIGTYHEYAEWYRANRSGNPEYRDKIFHDCVARFIGWAPINGRTLLAGSGVYGDGEMLEANGVRNIVAIDAALGALRVGKEVVERAGGSGVLAQMDVTHLGFPIGERAVFDALYADSVFAHIPRAWAWPTLTGLRDVCKPKARGLVTALTTTTSRSEVFATTLGDPKTGVGLRWHIAYAIGEFDAMLEGVGLEIYSKEIYSPIVLYNGHRWANYLVYRKD